MIQDEAIATATRSLRVQSTIGKPPVEARRGINLPERCGYDEEQLGWKAEGRRFESRYQESFFAFKNVLNYCFALSSLQGIKIIGSLHRLVVVLVPDEKLNCFDFRRIFFFQNKMR